MTRDPGKAADLWQTRVRSTKRGCGWGRRAASRGLCWAPPRPHQAGALGEGTFVSAVPGVLGPIGTGRPRNPGVGTRVIRASSGALVMITWDHRHF